MIQNLSDQRWRLDHLYTITTKEGIKAPLVLNWAQQHLFANLWFSNIVLKARQLGMSSFINILMLDTCLFNPNTECGIIAHTELAGMDLLRRNVRQVYADLPEAIQSLVPLVSDSAHHVRFANGSSIRVATTMRGSSLQLLHVSEFGKVAATNPSRAREIVSGSLETVGRGNLIFIESTAEGTSGYFYDYCQNAKALADKGQKLSSGDYRFFFFPWYQHPDYRLTAPQFIDDSLNVYFEKLSTEYQISLTLEQKNWYAAKRNVLGDDIQREYPSVPQEAFYTSMEGAYYLPQISRARKEGRIGYYPADTRYPFRVYMDLGISDDSTMIFEQIQNGRTVFFDFIENNGEPIQWYINKIHEHIRNGLIFDKLILPHDANKRDLATGRTLVDVVYELGVRNIEVLPATEINVGIQAARDRLTTAHFYETRCLPLVRHLENYSRDWNTRLGTWSDKPRHDAHSHAADCMRYWAVYEPVSAKPKTRRETKAILR